ncbi:MAG: tRNA pseudouridine(65) synthase TruC [Thermodesulfovibrionales bacterium]
MKTLSILYQDEHLVAVNKPSGLLVHRSMIDRSETENAMRTLRDQLGQWVYPLHRLDKPTSGVLVFALDKETARLMSQSFSDGQASKHYLAIVRGFTKELECIDYPLKDLWDKMTDQKATRDKPEKASVTQYRRLATIELPHPVGRYSTARYSLIKVAPLTGRNRQIRRHMKHIFHPVVGDTTYGDGKQNDFFRKKFNCCRLLLHAIGVEFIHPYSEKRLHIQAPLDPTFDSLLETLQWDKAVLS